MEAQLRPRALVTRIAPRRRGDVRQVSLDPTGRYLAYGIAHAADAEILVAGCDGSGERLLCRWAYPPRRFAWSADGGALAWLAGGPADHVGGDRVGWCVLDGEVRHRRGNAVSWLAAGTLVIVEQDALALIDVGGDCLASWPIEDDAHPLYAPQIAVSPSGRIAFGTRSAEQDLAALWTSDGRSAPVLVSEVPGARCWLSPFWAPDAQVAGVHIVHAQFDKSAIVLFDDPDGRVLYQSTQRDHPVAPAWVAGGIVWLAAAAPSRPDSRAPAQLSQLDPRTGAVAPLAARGTITGQLRANGDEVWIDGHACAWRLRLE